MRVDYGKTRNILRNIYASFYETDLCPPAWAGRHYRHTCHGNHSKRRQATSSGCLILFVILRRSCNSSRAKMGQSACMADSPYRHIYMLHIIVCSADCKRRHAILISVRAQLHRPGKVGFLCSSQYRFFLVVGAGVRNCRYWQERKVRVRKIRRMMAISRWSHRRCCRLPRRRPQTEQAATRYKFPSNLLLVAQWWRLFLFNVLTGISSMTGCMALLEGR